MAHVAVPKRARPHQQDALKSANETWKQKLVERIARGDLHGAESIRQEMREAHEALARAAETANSANDELSFVCWRNENGDIERLEITATPEAKAYFEQVMARESIYY